MYDAQRGKKAFMPFGNSEGADKGVHPCRVIRTFSVRQHIFQYLLIRQAVYACDQPVHLRRLIRAFVDHKLTRAVLRFYEYPQMFLSRNKKNTEKNVPYQEL